MKNFTVKERYTTEDLEALVRRLRDPVDGCPWDKVQTHESIRQNFIEETYEAADAIDKGDRELLCEELGDVLLQVMLHAEIDRQSGGFDLDDVATGICKKLVLRHPHIFANVAADSADEVLSNWEDIKRVEKKQTSGTQSVRDVARALPALTRSAKVQKRAGYVGFDYPDCAAALSDLRSETDELERALDGDGDVFEELGDLLFATVNVARFIKADPELALIRACDKFAARFEAVESLAGERGLDMKTAGIDTLNELWDIAKQRTVHTQENKD